VIETPVAGEDLALGRTHAIDLHLKAAPTQRLRHLRDQIRKQRSTAELPVDLGAVLRVPDDSAAIESPARQVPVNRHVAG
jgi:hypothetical protein